MVEDGDGDGCDLMEADAVHNDDMADADVTGVLCRIVRRLPCACVRAYIVCLFVSICVRAYFVCVCVHGVVRVCRIQPVACHGQHAGLVHDVMCVTPVKAVAVVVVTVVVTVVAAVVAVVVTLVGTVVVTVVTVVLFAAFVSLENIPSPALEHPSIPTISIADRHGITSHPDPSLSDELTAWEAKRGNFKSEKKTSHSGSTCIDNLSLIKLQDAVLILPTNPLRKIA